jgi:hypothetical protein
VFLLFNGHALELANPINLFDISVFKEWRPAGFLVSRGFVAIVQV